jgi:hypothetical protein
MLLQKWSWRLEGRQGLSLWASIVHVNQKPTLPIVRVEDITDSSGQWLGLNRTYRCFTANPKIYVDRQVSIRPLILLSSRTAEAEIRRITFEPIEMTLAHAVIEAAG